MRYLVTPERLRHAVVGEQNFLGFPFVDIEQVFQVAGRLVHVENQSVVNFMHVPITGELIGLGLLMRHFVNSPVVRRFFRFCLSRVERFEHGFRHLQDEMVIRRIGWPRILHSRRFRQWPGEIVIHAQ